MVVLTIKTKEKERNKIKWGKTIQRRKKKIKRWKDKKKIDYQKNKDRKMKKWRHKVKNKKCN